AGLHLRPGAGLGRPEPPGHGRGRGPRAGGADLPRQRPVEPPARLGSRRQPPGGGAASVGHQPAPAELALPPPAVGALPLPLVVLAGWFWPTWEAKPIHHSTPSPAEQAAAEGA